MFENRFNLTHAQNIFLAKKKWDENIYCGMRMENRAVTFPQTQTILKGINVSNVQIDDIQAILNMRDAWRFMLNTIEDPIDINYWCKLNEYIARNEALEWGVLRTGLVSISGTDYTPPIPEREKVIDILNNVCTDNERTATDKALDIFVIGARGQFFWDGNKRTSLMLANKILIMSGAGLLTITDKYMEQFNELLLDFYNTGESNKLKSFLYENSIQGMVV